MVCIYLVLVMGYKFCVKRIKKYLKTLIPKKKVNKKCKRRCHEAQQKINKRECHVMKPPKKSETENFVYTEHIILQWFQFYWYTCIWSTQHLKVFNTNSGVNCGGKLTCLDISKLN